MTTSSPTAVPDGFVALKADNQAAKVGCLLVLAAALLPLGTAFIAAFIINPAGRGDPWVAPLVGGAFVLVGGFLLYAGVKGARGAKIPPAELLAGTGVAFRPGTSVKLRFRQPGPATIDSLTLKACCERVYQRQVERRSSRTVEDHELVWEQILLEILNERVPAGGLLERDVVFALPPDAQPTGRARPDGRIRWQLQAHGDAGVLRAIYHAFDIRVEQASRAIAPAVVALEAGRPGGAAAAPAADWSAVFKEGAADRAEAEVEPPVRAVGRGRGQSARAARGRGGLSFNAGCLAISVPFLFCGSFFLWAFFSGMAFQGKGNPYMALFGGLLFGGIGLLGTIGGAINLVASKGSRKAGRSR